MSRIDPGKICCVDIILLEFLKAVLPDPGDPWDENYRQTSIGCRIRGLKDQEGAHLLHFGTIVAMKLL